VLRALIPFVLGTASLAIFKWWLVSTGRTPGYTDLVTVGVLRVLRNTHELAALVLHHIFIAVLYLGLFCCPFLLFSSRNMLRPSNASSRMLAACGFVLVIAGFVIHLHYVRVGSGAPFMPVGWNILSSFGIGPIVLRDVSMLNVNVPPSLPAWFWVAVTTITVYGAVLFTLRLCKVSAEMPRARFTEHLTGTGNHIRAFLLLLCLLYLAPVIFTALFDEYLVPLTPLLAGALATKDLSPSFFKCAVLPRIFSVLLTLGLAVFSICGTRDYLMLNRVRWVALENLQRDLHVGPEDVDGGYEFNGWYLYDPKHEVSLDWESSGKNLWWVRRDTYLIGLGPIPDYTILKEYKYENWMPPHTQKIVVLRRSSLR